MIQDLVATHRVASKAAPSRPGDGSPRFDRAERSGIAPGMTKLILLLAVLPLLAGCAAADGSRPRLPPAGSGPTGPGGFNGGYAGADAGFSNLGTKSVPF